MTEPTEASKTPQSTARQTEFSAVDPQTLWQALSQTPGVGVSITDQQGQLIFVNDTAQVFFSDESGLDYAGKNIADFHPEAFVQERLALIKRVVDEHRPLTIEHIYRGRRIESTLWPIERKDGPVPRVLVVTRSGPAGQHDGSTDAPEVVRSQYIDLGPLAVLSNRELEVLVLLGHGMNVPEAAKAIHRSPKTIERHKSSISQKLNVSGQAELVSIVTSIGLELDDVHLKRLRST